MNISSRTLVHVDADATMKEYVDREGNQRTGLNVSQRTYAFSRGWNRGGKPWLIRSEDHRFN